MEAAQYESLGRADDALLVKMLEAGLVKLKAGTHSTSEAPVCFAGRQTRPWRWSQHDTVCLSEFVAYILVSTISNSRQ